METATIMLAVAGDRGNTVMKTGVTPSEVAVLRYLHGEDAVDDIEVTGEVKRSYNEERERLAESYGRQIGERKVAVAVNALFPGAAARLFDTFSELGLPDDLYKADGRMVPTAPKAKPAKKEAPKAAAPVQPDEDVEDEGKEMPDNKMFA
jgi:hypothetical protein